MMQKIKMYIYLMDGCTACTIRPHTPPYPDAPVLVRCTLSMYPEVSASIQKLLLNDSTFSLLLSYKQSSRLS